MKLLHWLSSAILAAYCGRIGIDSHQSDFRNGGPVLFRPSIAATAERIRNEFGRLDVLVNNAAISHAAEPGTPLAEIAKSGRASIASLDERRAVFETNMFGIIAVTQAMRPLLCKAPAGHIVNVSSAVGSLTLKSDPTNPYHAMFGIVYSQRDNARLNALGTRVDTHQGQRCVPGLHGDGPQQLAGTRTVEQAAREPVRLALLSANTQPASVVM